MAPHELLQRYASSADQAAFTAFVQQHFDFVYSIALRTCSRDPHLAADIAQAVFYAVAQHAATLARHPALMGWLHTTTRHQAAKHIDAQRRWQKREQQAHAMENTPDALAPTDEQWRQLQPLLDDAIAQLNAADREAILLRFFENQPHAQIAHHLGLNENTARMRIDRALEKLRTQLTRRGFTSTAVALGALLTSQTLQAAPVGLALQSAAAIQQTLVPASLLSSFLLKLKIMTVFKLAPSAVTLSAVLVCSGIVFANQQSRPSESATLLAQSNEPLVESNQAPSSVTPQATPAPVAPPKPAKERKPSNKATFVRHNG